jgi:hypothetical protein
MIANLQPPFRLSPPAGYFRHFAGHCRDAWQSAACRCRRRRPMLPPRRMLMLPLLMPLLSAQCAHSVL